MCVVRNSERITVERVNNFEEGRGRKKSETLSEGHDG